jgi:F-type H+-transporting ATPase subunit gamma
MNTKVIKQKMKSVGSIKKITRTMEMVSVAKMKKASDKAFAIKSFNDIALEILRATAADKALKHALLTERNSGETLTLLFAGNKGLCGGYNSQLFRTLNKDFKQGNKIIAIGKYGEKIAKRLSADIVLAFPKNNLSDSEVRVTVAKILEMYTAKDTNIRDVKIVNAELINAASYKIKSKVVLPFKLDTVEDALDNTNILNESTTPREYYTYEPSESVVIDQIIPLLLSGIITASSRSAEAAEHAARMVAMKTATDNAGEMLADLKLSYNTARQAKITQEIAEISSGAMAMSN